MTLGITAAGLATAGSIAAGVGGLASGGAALAGALGGGGGGGGGGYPVALNPGQQDLKFLFGKGPISAQGKKQFENSVFGPGFKDLVSNYAYNPTSFGDGTPILSSIIGNPQDYLANFNKSLGFLDQAVNTADEATRTGFKTDGSAYFDEAIRKYMTEALPAAAETAGLGVSSSGFQAAASRASSDLLGQASLANIDLSEAAANRRLQAAPLLQGLVAGRQQLPLNIASDLSGLFNAEARKPIDTFSQLYNLNNAQYAAPSYNPTNTGAGNTAALIAGLGQLGGSLGTLAGVYNRGSGSSNLNPQNWGSVPDINLGA